MSHAGGGACSRRTGPRRLRLLLLVGSVLLALLCPLLLQRLELLLLDLKILFLMQHFDVEFPAVSSVIVEEVLI